MTHYWWYCYQSIYTCKSSGLMTVSWGFSGVYCQEERSLETRLFLKGVLILDWDVPPYSRLLLLLVNLLQIPSTHVHTHTAKPKNCDNILKSSKWYLSLLMGQYNYYFFCLFVCSAQDLSFHCVVDVFTSH